VTYTLHLGDCLDVMATMPDNSVDSIITDPPYGLEFMGKDWDHGIPGIAFWELALRVAKPGAILMAFGGTRTFHRLACAIEDAGWEIRDTIGWIYASGFPKSHQFGCKCRGGMVQYTHEKDTIDHLPLRDVRDSVSPATELGKEECGAVLQPPLCGPAPSREPCEVRQQHEGAGAQGQTVWPGQPGMEGRGDVLAQAWKLQTDQVRQVPGGVATNGAEGRVHYGAPSTDGPIPQSLPIAGGSGASSEPRPAGQQTGEPGIVCDEPGTQDSGRCPTCGGLLDFAGYGTALKPAAEWITVAMKPLDGTFAQNAQKWGVAGLWIDGSRVEGIAEVPFGVRRNPTNSYSGGWQAQNKGAGMANDWKPSPSGRWPANLLHDGSDEVLAGFPQSKSTGGSGFASQNPHRDGRTVGQFLNGTRAHMGGLGDSGSAARFFYCAKASRAEREAGCEGMEAMSTAASSVTMPKRKCTVCQGWIRTDSGTSSDNRPNSTCHCEHPSPSADMSFRQNPTLNHHPTVKPLAIMRYLCRLTKTPTGGVVLDPFLGSGTTGCAAIMEGREFIGIEKESEYMAIAARRIAAAASQMRLEGM
jgi:DNA modification methylase